MNEAEKEKIPQQDKRHMKKVT